MSSPLNLHFHNPRALVNDLPANISQCYLLSLRLVNNLINNKVAYPPELLALVFYRQ